MGFMVSLPVATQRVPFQAAPNPPPDLLKIDTPLPVQMVPSEEYARELELLPVVTQRLVPLVPLTVNVEFGMTVPIPTLSVSLKTCSIVASA